MPFITAPSFVSGLDALRSTYAFSMGCSRATHRPQKWRLASHFFSSVSISRNIYVPTAIVFTYVDRNSRLH